jgi:uncharacterized protein YkwD
MKREEKRLSFAPPVVALFLVASTAGCLEQPRTRVIQTDPEREVLLDDEGATGDAGPAVWREDGGSPPLPDSRPRPDSKRAQPDTGSGTSCGQNAMELGVFVLLDQERANAGLSSLACDPAAVKAARDYSEAMCTQNFFSHTGLDGSTVITRLIAAGASFYTAGENIAKGYSTPQDVHDGWMSSPGHKANMMSTTWTRVGIGYWNCSGTAYWTEDFLL